jgi:DNA-binding NarL/FixJ family response regulator
VTPQTITTARLGEIGHELNNLLMAIQGLADVPGAGTEQVLAAAGRAATLADELIRASLAPPGAPARRIAAAEPRVALVVEDEPVVGELAGRMLTRRGYAIIHAGSGEAALQVLQDESRPIALVLTDIVMPGLNGVAVAREAARTRPRAAVIVMSGYTEERFAHQIDADVVFLHKPFALADLDAALASAGMGSAPACLPDAREEGPVTLTPREIGVLTLLAEGQTNDQAANRLGIAPDTVQSHVHHAMKKLGAESRTQAVAAAMRLALIG